MAMTALSLALTSALSCAAEGVGDQELATLQAAAKKAFDKNAVPFVKEYCLECHSNRRSKGGLNFEVAVRKPGDPAFARKWMDAIANVNAHDMPPEDADQPSEDERKRFLDAIAQIKYLAARDPGPFVIRRLTKVEYGNTLHDFLGVDAAIAKELPDEVPGEGYLNSLSPMQTEQYLGIANAALQKMPAEALKRLFGNMGDDVREVARSIARTAYRRPPTDD